MEGLPGMFRPILPHADASGVEHVLQHRPLQRALEASGRTIDDVINNSLAREHVAGFYRLHCWVERESERSELEKQWASAAFIRRQRFT